MIRAWNRTPVSVLSVAGPTISPLSWDALRSTSQVPYISQRTKASNLNPAVLTATETSEPFRTPNYSKLSTIPPFPPKKPTMTDHQSCTKATLSGPVRSESPPSSHSDSPNPQTQALTTLRWPKDLKTKSLLFPKLRSMDKILHDLLYLSYGIYGTILCLGHADGHAEFCPSAVGPESVMSLAL